MFYGPDGRSADGRRTYGKGGKGGAAEAAQQQAQAARSDEEDRQAKIKAATDSVNQQFSGFDEPYFKNISDSYLAYQQPLLTEQAAKARHDLPYKFARTDNSDYQRVAAELERDTEREQANLNDKALDVANQQRSSVEGNRADLVQLANSGTDASAVATQAANRAAGLARPPAFSPIADLFDKYAQNYALANSVSDGGTVPGGNFAARALSFGAPRNAAKTVGG